MNIKLTRKEKIRINGPESIYRVMRQILMREDEIERSVEHFWCIGMAPNNTIIYIELVSLGCTTQAQVKPMEVFRVAIMKGAVNMILVHNHPGENQMEHDLMPSESDNDLTDRMIQVGKIVNIQVVDHLIISPDYYYSYQQSGLLSALEKSKKWVPPFQEEERIRKEALKIGKEAGLKEGKKIGLEKGIEKGMKKGRKEGKKEGKKVGVKEGMEKVAKKMKKKGESVETISEYTGLSKEEIEKL